MEGVVEGLYCGALSFDPYFVVHVDAGVDGASHLGGNDGPVLALSVQE